MTKTKTDDGKSKEFSSPTTVGKVIEERIEEEMSWISSMLNNSDVTEQDLRNIAKELVDKFNDDKKAIKKLEQEKDEVIAINRSEVYDKMNGLVKENDKRIESLEIQNTELYEKNKEVEKRYKLRNDDAKNYAKNLILLKKEKESNEMEIKSIRKKLEELEFYKKDRRLARQELNKYLRYFNENIELQKEINELKTKLKEKDDIIRAMNR